jgi:hypothetical protein
MTEASSVALRTLQMVNLLGWGHISSSRIPQRDGGQISFTLAADVRGRAVMSFESLSITISRDRPS